MNYSNKHIIVDLAKQKTYKFEDVNMVTFDNGDTYNKVTAKELQKGDTIYLLTSDFEDWFGTYVKDTEDNGEDLLVLKSLEGKTTIGLPYKEILLVCKK
ncbi:hypothetical protein [Capnocytophaga sputigena]|uniref:hypothetical protein n=1 Tax=Capnocytophaga sputigena TaxID=1019 RepID=UPI003C78480A